jgi:hypothetical protein
MEPLVDKSERILFVVTFLLLTACALFPIWAFEYLPILDYPNHMARMFVINNLGHDANLQKFYVINFQMIPNLAIDIIVPFLMRFVSVDVAGRLMLSINTVAFVVGPILLNFALFRKLGFNSLIIFLTLFNMAFFLGLMNFVFGVGIAFMCLACWVLLREKDIRLRIPIFLILPMILFFSHLYGLAVYAIGIAGYELGRTFSKTGTERKAAFRELLLSGLQFVLPACLFFLGASSPFGGGVNYRPIYDKLITLPSRLFWTNAYPPVGRAEVGSDNYWIGVAILVFLLLIIIWAVYERSFHKGMIIPILLLFVAYLCLPRNLATSALADYRALVPLSMMLVASIDWTIGPRKVKSLISAVFIFLFTINLYSVTTLWNDMQPRYAEMDALIQNIEKGSRLFAYFTGESGDPMACMVVNFPPRVAIVERSAMSSVFFANRFQQPVQFAQSKIKAIVKKRPWPDGYCIMYGQDHHEPSDWDGIVSDYDYILINKGQLLSEIPKDQLTLVKEGERFALFQTVK